MNFRSELVRLYQETQEQHKRATDEMVRDYLQIALTILVKILKAYDAQQKGDIAMAKLELDDLVLGTVKLADVRKRKTGSEVADFVLKLSQKIKPGDAKQLDISKINPNTFANTVYNMRKAGELPKDFTVVRTKDEDGNNQLFLARDTSN